MAQMLGYDITNYTLTIDGSSIRLILLNGVSEVLNYASTEAAEVEYDASNNAVRLKIGNVEYVKIDASNAASIDAGGVAKTLVTEHFDYMEATVDSHNAGGGGGSTTLFYQLTEAQAITAITNQTLEPGATYQVILDGTSQGNNGDYVNLTAIDIGVFAQNVTYFSINESVFVVLTGTFTAAGWAFKSADPNASRTNLVSQFDDGTDTLTIEPYTAFGMWPIEISGNEDLVTIVGGFEGMEITIYATGGGAFNLSVLDGASIKIPGGQFNILDNNMSFLKLKKRGSEWLQIGSGVF